LSQHRLTEYDEGTARYVVERPADQRRASYAGPTTTKKDYQDKVSAAERYQSEISGDSNDATFTAETLRAAKKSTRKGSDTGSQHSSDSRTNRSVRSSVFNHDEEIKINFTRSGRVNLEIGSGDAAKLIGLSRNGDDSQITIRGGKPNTKYDGEGLEWDRNSRQENVPLHRTRASSRSQTRGFPPSLLDDMDTNFF
jgi:hypothetical protein